MKRVWGLTSGSYSDWTVHALFETEADAQAAADAYTKASDYGDGEIQEFVYYEAGETPRRIVWFTCYQTLSDSGEIRTDGKIARREAWEYNQDETFSKRPKVEIKYTPKDPSPARAWVGYYNISIVGSDRAAVAKTWSDLRAQWKAQGHRLNAGSTTDLSYRLSATGSNSTHTFIAGKRP